MARACREEIVIGKANRKYGRWRLQLDVVTLMEIHKIHVCVRGGDFVVGEGGRGFFFFATTSSLHYVPSSFHH